MVDCSTNISTCKGSGKLVLVASLLPSHCLQCLLCPLKLFLSCFGTCVDDLPLLSVSPDLSHFKHTCTTLSSSHSLQLHKVAFAIASTSMLLFNGTSNHVTSHIPLAILLPCCQFSLIPFSLATNALISTSNYWHQLNDLFSQLNPVRIIHYHTLSMTTFIQFDRRQVAR